MSDDETLVRQRLLLMFGEPALRSASPSDPPGPGDSPGPDGPRGSGDVRAAGAPRGPGDRAGDEDRRDGADRDEAPEDEPSDARQPDPPDFEATLTAEATGLRRLGGVSAFDTGRRGVKALAALAAVVVLGAAFWAWRVRPAAEPVAVAPGSARTPVASAEAGPSSPAVTSPGPDAAELVVAVAGKVRRPGLVRLPAGARVADAIEAAGGALPGVDVTLLNPARRLTDGELIAVGVPVPPGAAGSGDGGQGVGGQPAVGAGGKLNLNTATLAQLDALPGVGPVLAQRILDHRQQHGAFRSVEDLRQVDGIGESRFQDLKHLVTV